MKSKNQERRTFREESSRCTAVGCDDDDGRREYVRWCRCRQLSYEAASLFPGMMAYGHASIAPPTTDLRSATSSVNSRPESVKMTVWRSPSLLRPYCFLFPLLPNDIQVEEEEEKERFHHSTRLLSPTHFARSNGSSSCSSSSSSVLLPRRQHKDDVGSSYISSRSLGGDQKLLAPSKEEEEKKRRIFFYILDTDLFLVEQKKIAKPKKDFVG